MRRVQFKQDGQQKKGLLISGYDQQSKIQTDNV